MEGQDRVVVVVFAAEHRGEGQTLDLILHGFDALAALVEQALVLLHVRKLDQREGIVILPLDAVVIRDLPLQHRDALEHLLGIFKILPEAVFGGLRLERRDLVDHFLEPQRLGQLLQRFFGAEQLQSQFFKL